MEFRHIGASGLKASVIGLGCFSFGSVVQSAREVGDTVAAAIDLGVNYFDTADVYGVGASETMLGAALAGRRDQVLIATKVGLDMGPGANDGGASRHRIISGCEDSLRRLGTDYIDLYQLHAPDPHTPIEETLRALDDLVRAGKVRYLGCSNFRAWQLCEAQWRARTNGLHGFVLTQDFYNLLYRGADFEMAPMCEQLGIGRTAYFPLAAGLLTDACRRDEAAAPGSRAARPSFETWKTPRNWARQEQLKALAAELGLSLAQLAIAWILTRPMICTVIAGADNAGHIRSNAEAAGLRLSRSALERIDAITWSAEDDRSVPPLYAVQPLRRWPR